MMIDKLINYYPYYLCMPNIVFNIVIVVFLHQQNVYLQIVSIVCV